MNKKTDQEIEANHERLKLEYSKMSPQDRKALAGVYTDMVESHAWYKTFRKGAPSKVHTLDKRASVTVEPGASNNAAVRDLRDQSMADEEQMAALAREISHCDGKPLQEAQLIARRYLQGEEAVSPLAPVDRDIAERAMAALRQRRAR